MGLLLIQQGASGATLSGPLSQSDVLALNGAGATYGPPPGAGFADGPFIVASGNTIDLFAGPKPGRGKTQDLLFVVSAASGASPSIQFEFAGVGTQSLSASDFFSTAALGFPASINGIANGVVNGLAFPTSIHAALRLSGLNLGSVEGADLGDLVVTSGTPLRIDIFGIADGKIVNNTPNSHSIGVGVPEPTSVMGVLGALGFGGLLARSCRKQR